MRPMPELKVVEVPTEELLEYPNNAKLHPHEQIDQIASSIEEFGFNSPILAWHNDQNEPEIVAGHGRLMAAKKLGLESLPVVFLDHMSDEQRRAYIVLDNQLTMNSGWDFSILDAEIGGLDYDWEYFGIYKQEEKTPMDRYKDAKEGSLASAFVAPPFSVLDTRQGYWRDRKRDWLSILPDSRDGRPDDLLGDGLKSLAKTKGDTRISGTSEFDPVLCEILYQWFAPPQGFVIDPFAGGTVRGAVADFLGLRYKGIELRQEQVDANNGAKAEYGIANAEWVCDDSLNADKHIEDGEADFIIACPPYYDLEVYSDDPRDLSNMDCAEFLSAYRDIVSVFARKLKDDRFAAFVVGDVRGKDGFYLDFITDTKQALKDAGLHLYNELILIESMATSALRAGNFKARRKVVKTHQNVLVFYKGETAPQMKTVLVYYKGNPKHIKGMDQCDDLVSASRVDGGREAVEAVRRAVNGADDDSMQEDDGSDD